MNLVEALLDQLKNRLVERKDKFVRVDEWCGDTEGGFYDEVHFSMDDLLAEIDKFGEEVRERAKELGL